MQHREEIVLEYEATFESERRRLKLLKDGASAINMAMIFFAVFMSSLVSVALAAMGVLILLRSIIGR